MSSKETTAISKKGNYEFYILKRCGILDVITDMSHENFANEGAIWSEQGTFRINRTWESWTFTSWAVYNYMYVILPNYSPYMLYKMFAYFLNYFLMYVSLYIYIYIYIYINYIIITIFSVAEV